MRILSLCALLWSGCGSDWDYCLDWGACARFEGVAPIDRHTFAHGLIHYTDHMYRYQPADIGIRTIEKVSMIWTRATFVDKIPDGPAGQHWGEGRVTVALHWNRDWGRNSLFHEITHHLLEHVYDDADIAHLRKAWWKASNDTKIAWGNAAKDCIPR